MPETIDAMELRERVAYAETAVSVYCSEFLAAREEERAARRKVSETASKWGRAWRELTDARAALARAGCTAPRLPIAELAPGPSSQLIP